MRVFRVLRLSPFRLLLKTLARRKNQGELLFSEATGPDVVLYDRGRYGLYCTLHINTLPWFLIQRDPFDIAMAAFFLFCGGISKLSFIVLK